MINETDELSTSFNTFQHWDWQESHESLGISELRFGGHQCATLWVVLVFGFALVPWPPWPPWPSTSSSQDLSSISSDLSRCSFLLDWIQGSEIFGEYTTLIGVQGAPALGPPQDFRIFRTFIAQSSMPRIKNQRGTVKTGKIGSAAGFLVCPSICLVCSLQALCCTWLEQFSVCVCGPLVDNECDTCESQLENSQCMHGVLRRTEQFGLTLISNLNSAVAKRYWLAV